VCESGAVVRVQVGNRSAGNRAVRSVVEPVSSVRGKSGKRNRANVTSQSGGRTVRSGTVEPTRRCNCKRGEKNSVIVVCEERQVRTRQ